MNKILVTTDFSVSSKAGIRFALQCARQTDSKLIFFHTQELLKPTRWSEEKYNAYAALELKKTHQRLMRFVTALYPQTGLSIDKAEFVVTEGSEVVPVVIEYAKHIKANYICMSTRGAGGVKKWIGNHASDLIAKSPVPVIVVPKTYRVTKISRILYSSDMSNLTKEMRKVLAFSELIKAKVSVYYYNLLLPLKDDKMKLAKKAGRYASRNVKFHFEKLDAANSLSNNLKTDIKKSRASLLVLFTRQNRDWYERLFSPSKSSAISFDTKTPLIIFRKTN